MPALSEYHKPTDVEEALALLQRVRPRTVPLAGGTWLNPRLGKQVQADAVVDLSGLGLDQIERDPDTLRIGPLATLTAVAKNPVCGALADGILARAARYEAPINIRNVATVGGTMVVAAAGSQLVLALLALGAELVVRSAGTRVWPLDNFLDDPAAALAGGLIIQLRVNIPLFAAGGMARLGRTPADRPIVAAVAAITEDANAVRIAVGGVTHRPLVVSLAQTEGVGQAITNMIEAAEPSEDFRGSAGYRREMGIVMAQRALAQAVANCTRC